MLEQVEREAKKFENRSRGWSQERRAAWSLRMKQSHAAGKAEILTGDLTGVVTAIEQLIAKRTK